MVLQTIKEGSFLIFIIVHALYIAPVHKILCYVRQDTVEQSSFMVMHDSWDPCSYVIHFVFVSVWQQTDLGFLPSLGYFFQSCFCSTTDRLRLPSESWILCGIKDLPFLSWMLGAVSRSHSQTNTSLQYSFILSSSRHGMSNLVLACTCCA